MIFFVIILLACRAAAHPLNLGPNKNWECLDCERLYGGRDKTIGRVFGIVRSMLHKAPRNVYFAMDTSWMDNLLRFESKVVVRAISFSTLDSFVVPSPDPKGLPANEHDEVYQVVYSELASGVKFNVETVDTFLALNPCWIPLHEPPLGAVGATSSSPPLHFQSSLKFAKYNSFIFLRLPVIGFHATCRLFSAITRLQHPSKCIYDEAHMMTHHLHNTGWSATFNAILFKLAHILHQEVFPRKILVIPRAIDFRSRVRRLHDRNGTTFSSSGGWYWSNPETCPQLTEAYDPYACNFISLSNCTRFSTGTSLMAPPFPPPSRDYNWETPQTVRWKGFDLEGGADSDSIETLRSRFHDAPLFEEEQWCYSRFHAFLQRPNARLRAGIRNSFRNLEFLSAVSGAVSASVSASASSRDRDGGYAVMKKHLPCVAIHVRHGDSRHDTRGNPNRRIDRSLASHVFNARNLTMSLGVTNLFIASDNLSVIAHAARDHPQYHWSTQRRPIRDWPGMYDVHNENDMTQELAHVIADTRIAAMCDGIVGCFDSGFAEQMLVAGCQHSKLGRCPPTVDLRFIYNDY